MRDATYADELDFFSAQRGAIKINEMCIPREYGAVDWSRPFYYRLTFEHVAPYLGLRTEKMKRADLRRLTKPSDWRDNK